jgi:hypothetical protein
MHPTQMHPSAPTQARSDAGLRERDAEALRRLAAGMRLAAFEIGRSTCTALQCVEVMHSVRREIDAFCERVGEENIVLQQSRFWAALSATHRARGTPESSSAPPDAAPPHATRPPAMMRSVRAGLVPVYEEARELVERLCAERWRAAPLPRLSVW